MKDNKMTDEITQTIKDAKQADEAITEEVVEKVEAAPEYSEKELEALDAGWKPEGTDKDGNSLNADEYMARKPLFNKIHNMREEMDTMKSQLATVSADSVKMGKAFMQEKADLLVQLKEKREAALDDLDTAEVRKLDKQIENVATTTQEATETTEAPVYDGDAWKSGYVAFLKENSWYDTAPGLKSVADIEGQAYCKDNPTASPTEVYKHVTEYVKKEFSDRFEEKQTNSKVSSASRRTSTSSSRNQGVKLSDLDEETQRVVLVMSKAVGKTTEEYLKNYEL